MNQLIVLSIILYDFIIFSLNLHWAQI